MTKTVIQFENLGKSYMIGHKGQTQGYVTLRDVVGEKFIMFGPASLIRDTTHTKICKKFGSKEAKVSNWVVSQETQQLTIEIVIYIILECLYYIFFSDISKL